MDKKEKEQRNISWACKIIPDLIVMTNNDSLPYLRMACKTCPDHFLRFGFYECYTANEYIKKDKK